MSEFRMVLLFEMHVIWNGIEYNMCVMIVVLFCNLTNYCQTLKAVQMNFMYSVQVYIGMGIPVYDLEIPRDGDRLWEQ